MKSMKEIEEMQDKAMMLLDDEKTSTADKTYLEIVTSVTGWILHDYHNPLEDM